MATSTTLSALDLLKKPPDDDFVAAASVVAVTSAEPFLVFHALAVLRDRLCPEEEDRSWAWKEFVGDEIEDARDVFDEASTVPMFATATRAAVVRDADGFVTRFREPLEKLADSPRGRRGLVILEVKSLSGNTRLAKMIAKNGIVIDTAIPPRANLATWLVAWAKSRHARTLQKAAAERLLERVDGDLGQIDRAIARIAATEPGTIGPEQVDEIGAGPRERSAWEMIDLAATGRTAAAISQLSDLLESGESPIAIAAQISSVLRKVAAAARLLALPQAAGRPAGIREALEEAGVATWPKAMEQATAALRNLGPARARSLPAWLLQADRALKGEASRGFRAQLALERLFCKMMPRPDEPGRGPFPSSRPRSEPRRP